MLRLVFTGSGGRAPPRECLIVPPATPPAPATALIFSSPFPDSPPALLALDRLRGTTSTLSAGPPRVGGAGAKDPGDPPPSVRAGPLELPCDQVLAADTAAEGLPELRLQGATRDPAVGGLVGQVADDRAGQLEVPALRDVAVAEVL